MPSCSTSACWWRSATSSGSRLVRDGARCILPRFLFYSNDDDHAQALHGGAKRDVSVLRTALKERDHQLLQLELRAAQQRSDAAPLREELQQSQGKCCSWLWGCGVV